MTIESAIVILAAFSLSTLALLVVMIKRVIDLEKNFIYFKQTTNDELARIRLKWASLASMQDDIFELKRESKIIDHVDGMLANLETRVRQTNEYYMDRFEDLDHDISTQADRISEINSRMGTLECLSGHPPEGKSDMDFCGRVCKNEVVSGVLGDMIENLSDIKKEFEERSVLWLE